MLAIRCENEIMVTDCFLYKDSIKEINGRRYDADNKAWFVPYSAENIALLEIFGAEIGEGLKSEQQAVAVQAESAVVCMPIKATPYKHQIAAFNFALRIFGGAI